MCEEGPPPTPRIGSYFFLLPGHDKKGLGTGESEMRGILHIHHSMAFSPPVWKKFKEKEILYVYE
jgi:hypothetical protein